MADDSVQTPSDGGTQSPESDPELLAGRYRLGKALGEGGMGQVYRAEHVLMKKQVAIKVLRRELSADDEIVARFHREARAAAALDHPNVCQATDFGRNDEGAFFLVMEHLDGQTLQQLLEKRGRLPVERALHITGQIASALEVAHAQGIVHRDLKPENVMLVDRHGDPDTVKIMDFGIARLVATTGDGDDDGADGPTRLTRAGMVYGTPHYMSPEQVAGENVDNRTDLYALGVVLFEMLAGAPPYDGGGIARVMGQHITSPIPSVRSRCPEASIPAEIDALVTDLLAKDREDRPPTAGALLSRLESLDNDTNEAPQVHTTAALTAIATATATATDRLRAVTGQGVGRLQALWGRLGQTERLLVSAAGFVAFFLFLAVFATAAILFFDSEGRKVQALDDSHEALLDDEEISSALNEARGGNRGSLSELLSIHPDDAQLRYLALEADLEAGRSVDLVEESAAILEMDSRYAHDEEFVERLVARLTSRSDGEAVRELLAKNMTNRVRELLAREAREGSRRAHRDAAYELLEEQKQLRRLSRWERIAAELRQTSGCEERRELVNKLAAIGDPGAIPVLEIYDQSSTRGCGRLNLSDCHGCMRSDLKDALEALRDD